MPGGANAHAYPGPWPSRSALLPAVLNRGEMQFFRNGFSGIVFTRCLIRSNCYVVGELMEKFRRHPYDVVVLRYCEEEATHMSRLLSRLATEDFVQSLTMRPVDRTLRVRLTPESLGVPRLVSLLAELGMSGVEVAVQPPPAVFSIRGARDTLIRFVKSDSGRAVLTGAATILLPLVAERFFGRAGKALVKALLS